MKCVVLISTNMANVPLAECGGIHLLPGDRLIVRDDIYKQMKPHYGKNLIVAQDVEKATLSCVHYQYETAKFSAKASEVLDAPAGAEAPVAGVASDKSMFNSLRTKKK